MTKHHIMRSSGEGLEYGWTDSPKPKKQPSIFTGKVYCYDVALRQWLSSITWTKVKKEDEQAFRELAWPVFLKFKHGHEITSKNFDKALSEMIEIHEGLVEIERR